MSSNPVERSPNYFIDQHKPSRHDTVMKICLYVAVFFGAGIFGIALIGHLGVFTSANATQLTTLGAITTKIANALSMTPHGICVFGESVGGVVAAVAGLVLYFGIYNSKKSAVNSNQRLADDLGYPVSRPELSERSRPELQQGFKFRIYEFLVKALSKDSKAWDTLWTRDDFFENDTDGNPTVVKATDEEITTLQHQLRNATMDELIRKLQENEPKVDKDGKKLEPGTNGIYDIAPFRSNMSYKEKREALITYKDKNGDSYIQGSYKKQNELAPSSSTEEAEPKCITKVTTLKEGGYYIYTVHGMELYVTRERLKQIVESNNYIGPLEGTSEGSTHEEEDEGDSVGEKEKTA